MIERQFNCLFKIYGGKYKMKKLTQAFSRIEQIDWNNTEDNKPSYTILINEFISTVKL